MRHVRVAIDGVHPPAACHIEPEVSSERSTSMISGQAALLRDGKVRFTNHAAPDDDDPRLRFDDAEIPLQSEAGFSRVRS